LSLPAPDGSGRPADGRRQFADPEEAVRAVTLAPTTGPSWPSIPTTMLGAVYGSLEVRPAGHLLRHTASLWRPVSSPRLPGRLAPLLARRGRVVAAGKVLQASNQITKIAVQRFGQPGEGVEGGVPLAGLQAADVRAIDGRLVGERLLAEANIVTALLDPVAQDPLSRGAAPARARHPAIWLCSDSG